MNVKNSSGLTFSLLENGSLQHIEAGQIRISMLPATFFSKSGANLYLRKKTSEYACKPLLGPESSSIFSVDEKGFTAKGNWAGLDYRCELQLSERSLSWQWRVTVNNLTAEDCSLDLVYVQDAGLKPSTGGLINEYYVSQYLERRILEDGRYGSVICCRQNMKEAGGHPWLLVACKNGAVSGSVDGMQLYGRTYRETGMAEGLFADSLSGEYAGESTVLALQEKPFLLASGSQHQSMFVGSFLPDHPLATSADDLHRLESLMTEFDGEYPIRNAPAGFHAPVNNLFNTSGFLPVHDLSAEEIDRFFGPARHHIETENGRLLSFFGNDNTHVVIRAKELLVDRPHAHIMQARTGYVPDERIMSTTAYAFGVFNSHLTQGNTNFNIFLSIVTGQFNLAPETGQRIFVEIGNKRYLLGVPSAFEIGLNHCRWIYNCGSHCFQVRTWTSKTAPMVHMDFQVLEGAGVKLMVTHQFDPLNSWKLMPGIPGDDLVFKPAMGSMIAGKFPDAQFRIVVNSPRNGYQAGGDELLYDDRQSRGGAFLILDVAETSGFCMSFAGEVCDKTETVIISDADLRWTSDCRDFQSVWKDLSLDLTLQGEQQDIAAVREILPWFGMNALTHFLTPYGLEQFSGAAWGTRDISQGPFDLLLCMEKYAEARQVLRIIFSNQDMDGGWPQWWMFDSYAHIRADSAHGDIFYWCLIALGNYIKVTGDLDILDERLPFYHENGAADAETATLSEHVDRLVSMIIRSFIPGTALVPFGGGDWNDSLQPVSRELAGCMISSWTVEMNYQAFDQYSVVYELAGNSGKAEELKNICARIRSDFNRYLVRDGVVAGYGLTEKGGNIKVLLHPQDDMTGIRYGILPMNRGVISGIFSREQAQHHQDLIEQHLKGPDGARLMDRPLRYRGGIQTLFQRAESSTFFGREIGIMYVHEHIRYAESQAIMGHADRFMKALRQANPVAYRDVVPCGDLRQANCYYSSSDVIFKNRYEADERYDEIKTGSITLRGGWRVYSSGPGIYIGLIVSRLLGIRREYGNLIIDPVIADELDGFSASMELMGFPVTFRYQVRENNFGPKAIFINGKPVAFTCQENTYRAGGAVIPLDRFSALLNHHDNMVEIQL